MNDIPRRHPDPNPDPAWPRLLRAIEFARVAHTGQLDKAGEPYFFHVLRVGVSLLPDVDAAIAGVLHDVLEDCPWGFEDLQKSPFPDKVVTALGLLSHDSWDSYESYIQRIAAAAASPTATEAGRIALLVKLADLDDNLNTGRLARAEAANHNMARLTRRYHWARACLTAARDGRAFGPRPGCADCDSYGCTMNCGPAVTPRPGPAPASSSASRSSTP